MSSYYNESINTPITWAGIPRSLAIPPTLLGALYAGYVLLSVDYGSLIYALPIFVFTLFYFIAIKVIVKDDIQYLNFWYSTYRLMNEKKGVLDKLTTVPSTPYVYPYEEFGVVTHTGSLVVTYEVEYADANALDELRRSWYEKDIQSILDLGNNVELHFNEYRTQQEISLDKSDFSSVLSQSIEDGVHETNVKKLSVSEYYLSLIFYDISLIDEVMTTIENTERKMKHFLKRCRRLSLNEHLSFLDRNVTASKREYEWKKEYVFIQDLLDYHINFKETLKVEDTNTVIISIQSLPENIGSRIFSYLSDQEFVEYRISSRFRPLSKEEIEKTFKRKIQLLETTQKSFIDNVRSKPATEDSIDLESAISMEGVRQARIDLSQNKRTYGHYSMQVILSSDELNTEVLLEVANSLIDNLPRGMTARIETVNAINSFLGSLPGNSQHNRRELLLNLDNLIDLVNLYSINIGNKTCPSPYMNDQRCLTVLRTRGFTPYYFNLHVGDVGHTVIVGQTGSGKSTFLSLIIAQFLRYKDAKVICLQKGKGMTPLIRGLGGKEIDPIGQKSFKFAPLLKLDSENKNDVNNFTDFILRMLALNDSEYRDRKADNFNVIKQGIIDTLGLKDNDSFHKVTQDLSFSESVSKTNHHDHDEEMGHAINISFSTLLEQIQDIEIKNVLEVYKDTVFDGFSDDFSNSMGRSQVLGVEMSNILNMSENMAVPIMEYIIGTIEKEMTGAPILIVVDEAQFLAQSEILSATMKDYLETIRKKNGAVIFATLSAQKFYDVSSSFFSTVNDSCLTKIFLASGTENINEIQFNIEEEAKEKITSLMPKREALIVKPDSHIVVTVEPPDSLIQFGTATPKDIELADGIDGDSNFYEKWKEIKEND